MMKELPATEAFGVQAECRIHSIIAALYPALAIQIFAHRGETLWNRTPMLTTDPCFWQPTCPATPRSQSSY